MRNQVVLVIGEVFVDTHLDIPYENVPLVRLGGIFHSARALSALNVSYALAYYAPGYLEDDIHHWSLRLNAKGCYKLGNINRSPNVMLIRDSKEAGKQDYNNLLQDQTEFIDNDSLEGILQIVSPTDILLFPGHYSVTGILGKLENYRGKLHIDIHYDSEGIFSNYIGKIHSIFLSTSSSMFLQTYHGSFFEFYHDLQKHQAELCLLKENRGGSTCYLSSKKQIINAPSYPVQTYHSVGVGDVFDALFISEIFENDLEKQMKFSSFGAAKYAETMDFELFKENIQQIYNCFDMLVSLHGVRLSWTDRCKKNIYLAAPDFPGVDTGPLDSLCECLQYHNFVPRRPIKENGLVDNEMLFPDEINIYYKDMALLKECDLLIAVLLYNDPGTFVELGIFKQAEKPTIIFDPYHICVNMFVRNTTKFLCHSIAEVIDATYQCLGGENNDQI